MEDSTFLILIIIVIVAYYYIQAEEQTVTCINANKDTKIMYEKFNEDYSDVIESFGHLTDSLPLATSTTCMGHVNPNVLENYLKQFIIQINKNVDGSIKTYKIKDTNQKYWEKLGITRFKENPMTRYTAVYLFKTEYVIKYVNDTKYVTRIILDRMKSRHMLIVDITIVEYKNKYYTEKIDVIGSQVKVD